MESTLKINGSIGFSAFCRKCWSVSAGFSGFPYKYVPGRRYRCIGDREIKKLTEKYKEVVRLRSFFCNRNADLKTVSLVRRSAKKDRPIKQPKNVFSVFGSTGHGGSVMKARGISVCGSAAALLALPMALCLAHIRKIAEVIYIYDDACTICTHRTHVCIYVHQDLFEQHEPERQSGLWATSRYLLNCRQGVQFQVYRNYSSSSTPAGLYNGMPSLTLRQFVAYKNC